jgi:hypothetical protein
MASETNFKRKVLAYLKKTYPNAWVYKCSDKFIAGIPDVLCCIQGRFIAIELKILPNKPTNLQIYVLELIRKAGGAVGVAYSINDVKNILERREPC